MPEQGRFGDLGTVWASIGLDYSSFDRGADRVATRTRELDRTTQRSLDRMTANWQQLGQTLSVAVTAPLTILGATMVNTFAGFEQSMANTASVANASASELEALTEAARSAGAATIFSASQSADALYDLASAGFDAEQSIAALPGVLDLAAATQADLAFTSAALASAISQFNLEASESTRVANVFAASAAASQGTMRKLADSMRYAGPVAAGFNITLEETVGVLSQLYNAGLRGEQAGTTLRQSLISLANPVGQTTEALAELGLTVEEVSPATNSLAEIFDTLNEAGVTTTQAMQLFGSEAGSGMAAALRQGGDALRQMTAAITGTNAAAELAEIQMDTLHGAALELASAYEELSLSLVESVEPVLRDIVEELTGLVRWMGDLPEPVYTSAAALAAFAAAAGPALIAMRGIAVALATLSGPTGWIALAAGGLAALGVAFASTRRDAAAYYDELAQDTRTTIAHVKELDNQAESLNDLLQEYQELSGKPDKSEEEHARLLEVVSDLAEEVPHAVTAFNAEGEALKINTKAVRAYRDELIELKTLELELAQARIEQAFPDLQERIPELRSALTAAQDELSDAIDEHEAALQSAAESSDLRRDWMSILFGPSQEQLEALPEFTRQILENARDNVIGIQEEVVEALRASNELQGIQRQLDILSGRAPGESPGGGEDGDGKQEPTGGEPDGPDLGELQTTADFIDATISRFQDRLAIAAAESDEALRSVQERYLAWLESQLAAAEGNVEAQAEIARELVSVQRQLGKEEPVELDQGLERVADTAEYVSATIDRFRNRLTIAEEEGEEALRAEQERFLAWLESQLAAAEGNLEAQAAIARELLSLRRALREEEPAPEEPATNLGEIAETAEYVSAAIARFRDQLTIAEQEGEDALRVQQQRFRAWLEAQLAATEGNVEVQATLIQELVRLNQSMGEQRRKAATSEAESLVGNLQGSEQTLAALQNKQRLLEEAAAHYKQMGEEGQQALQLIQNELAETNEQIDALIAGHPLMLLADEMEAVLAGRQDLGEAVSGVWQSLVDASAADVIDEVKTRMAEFIELATTGADSTEEAWTQAFAGMKLATGDWVTLAIQAFVEFFTAYRDARDQLEKEIAADREKRIEDEKEFAELVAAGFAGQFRTTTQTYTEEYSYLFGLIQTSTSDTLQVTSEETKAWIDRMQALFEDLRGVGRDALEDAFTVAPGAEFVPFLTSLREGIYEQVLDGLIDAFTQSRMFTSLMAPLFQAIDEGMTEAFQGGMFDPHAFWDIVRPALESFEEGVGGLEGPLAAMRELLAELQGELGIDLPEPGEDAASGGTRLTNLTGEQRDYFGELLRPVGVLDRLPGYHDAHMARLDTMIELMGGERGEIQEQFETFMQSEQATIRATSVTIEHIQNATLTGPIEGPVYLRADGQDLRTAIRQELRSQQSSGQLAARGTGT